MPTNQFFTVALLFAAQSMLGATSVHADLNQMKSVPYDSASQTVRNAVGIETFVEKNALAGTDPHLDLSVQIDSRGKFHIYEDRLSFWTENDAVVGGEWRVEVLKKADTVRFLDPISKALKSGYHGESIFEIRLRPASNTFPQGISLPDDHQLPLVVALQTCDDVTCLFPVALRMDVSVRGTAAAATAGDRDEGLSSEGLISRLSSFLRGSAGNNLSITLVVLLLAGVLTALTPCVYPLYPITVGIFTRWSATGAVAPIALMLAYCGGLTLSYAALGLVSVASGAVFGSLTQTPLFLIGVGVLILLSAIAFSGLVTISLPPRVQAWFARPESAATQKSKGRLLAQAAVMGAGLGAVASPCVGPVLVAILAWLSTSLAQGGGGSQYLKGFLLLSVFGIGMSIPFLVLGHIMIRLRQRPSLGRYTPYVKHVGTVVMVAASLFFIIPGVRLLNYQHAPHVEMDFPVASLDTWKREGWSVVDFRADWCAACIELERDTFSHDSIASLFKGGDWNYVKVDLTKLDEANEKITQEYQVLSLPSVYLYAPGGKLCENEKLFGFEGPKQFKARLERARAHGC